jgi:DNA-binding PadR family transcriptional regulator
MSLTELEGAVLSEIHHRGNFTAFKVRRAFQQSPSTEWSGSAGAVYPAIRRLAKRGLLRLERLETARRSNRLSLTPEGVIALEGWATDIGRAIGVGLDPFRLRSGIWAHLAPARQREHLGNLLRALDEEIAATEAGLALLDFTERPRARLATLLQRGRREWVRTQLKSNSPAVVEPGPRAASARPRSVPPARSGRAR